MSLKKSTNRYVTFLRGINVGGHHKLPMADLRLVMEKMGFSSIVTLLNSGNVIFEAVGMNTNDLERKISEKLEKTFEFPVPTIVRKAEMISQMYADQPFSGIEVHKDIRLYVSFLKEAAQSDLKLPWASPDNSYQILELRDKTVLSMLDLSLTGTPQTMESLEKIYGSDMTTRNWNTIERIVSKL